MKREYKLDKKDLKILDVVSDNARLSYSQIGKITMISKDRVRERILNLQKNIFILSFFPLIGYEKLGYRKFHVLISFKSLEDANKTQANIKRLNNVMAFTWLAGNYDYEIQLLSKNEKEIRIQLNKAGLTKDKIKKIVILPANIVYYTMLVNKDNNKELWSYKENRLESNKIDNIDKNILYCLSQEGRTKLIDMAGKLKVSPDVVRYRIKLLISKGIICGFYSRVNKHRFGLNSYIYLIKLKNNDKEILHEISKLHNVYYISSSKGYWTALLNLYAKDNKELIETLNKIRGISKSDILNSELIILLDRYFFNTFPEILLE